MPASFSSTARPATTISAACDDTPQANASASQKPFTGSPHPSLISLTDAQQYDSPPRLSWYSLSRVPDFHARRYGDWRRRRIRLLSGRNHRGVRDDATPFPPGGITPAPSARLRGRLHDIVPTLGIGRTFRRFAPPRRKSTKIETWDAANKMPEPDAAVAIVHARGAADSVLLMRRAEREADAWSGHWSFPGGRRKPEDSDLLHTALRELEEECGILLARARLEAALPAAVARRRVGRFLLVAPFVFRVDDEQPPALDPQEAVEAVWAIWGAIVDWGYKRRGGVRPSRNDRIGLWAAIGLSVAAMVAL